MPTPQEDYRTIPLSRGLFAIVDAEDFEWLKKWKWYADKSGSKRGDFFYAKRTLKADEGGKRGDAAIKMHRAIMGLGAGDKLDVDHINMDTLDNRRSNLRICTRSENRANTTARSDNKLGLKGVHWHKATKRFQAQIQFRGNRFQLGWYDDPHVAHAAYCEAAKKIHGEFARTC